MKPHQSIFLVLTRCPPKLRAPSFYGLSLTQAQAQARAKDIELQSFFLESNHPIGSCFAQSSSIGQELHQKSIALYCSSGLTTQRIFPDLTGRTIDEARSFLESHGITVSVSNPGATAVSTSGDALIKEQRPLAGSIVDLKKPLSVQLTLS